MSEIPSISVIEAIKPANAATGEEVLVYQGLASAIENYRHDESARFRRVLNSEDDSLEELSATKQLASQYLLENAHKVNTVSQSESHDVWADRFTGASIELYGAPNPTDAYALLVAEHKLFSIHTTNGAVSQSLLDFLLTTYDAVLGVAKSTGTAPDTELLASREAAEQLAIQRYGDAMRRNYQGIFDLVDDSKPEYTAQDLQQLFTEALDWLKINDDEVWGEWQAPLTSGTSLSVTASKQKINVAEGREPTLPKGATELLAHELLVHALRGKNGKKSGIKSFGTGLAGYLDAEEGLGILAEKAVVGELSEKVTDRYLDIALALGTVDGRQRNRRELFDISFARRGVTEQIYGSNKPVDALARTTWRHIDRIYRGGRGDSTNTRQAVFTKDIAYYVGYKQMATYLAEQLDAGISPDIVLDYLSRGKFDPTNPKHVAHINPN